MKSLLALFLTISLVPVVLAQPAFKWCNYYNQTIEDVGNCVSRTSDDGYIIAGRTGVQSLSGCDLILIKTDQDGNMIWANTYGCPYNDEGLSVIETSDGCYLVTGITNRIYTAYTCDAWVMKVDADGFIIWERVFNWGDIDKATDVVETESGDFVITGLAAAQYPWFYGDLLLLKLNSNGEDIWTRQYHYDNRDCGHAIDLVSDGGFIIAGVTDEDEYSDIGKKFIMRTDANGDTLWTFCQDSGILYDVLATSDGGFVSCGYSNSFSYGSKDMYVVKLDDSGQVLWEDVWGASYQDCGFGIVEIESGDYFAVGWTPNGYSPQLFFVKINSDGSTAASWCSLFDDLHEANAVTLSSRGNYIVTGLGVTSSGGFDVLLLETDEFNSVVAEIIPHEPEIIIPPEGGSFTYDIEIKNETTNDLTVNVSIYMTRLFYDYPHPVAVKPNISIDAGTQITRLDLEQTIPGNFEPDIYKYVIWVRDAATSSLLAQDIIFFEKLGEPGGQEACSLTGNKPELLGWENSRISSVSKPNEIELISAYPNPFNPSTTIRYSVPEAADVKLTVYDVSGRFVAEVIDGYQDAGMHTVAFDGSNLVSGLYIYRLTAGNQVASGKMMLIK